MDPASLALAIGAAKKIIDTCGDLKEAYKGIDALLSHAEAAEDHAAKKPKTRQQQILEQRAHDQGESDSFSEIADEVFTARNNAIALENLYREIDRKWGRGTVDEIKKIRTERKAKREKQAKEIAAAKKKEHEARMAFLKKWSIILAQLVGIAAAAVTIGYYVWANRCVEAVCR